MTKAMTSIFLAAAAALAFSGDAAAQEIPSDPNHLPTMIGGRSGSNSRVDAVTVSGKVVFDGVPSGVESPKAYVVVYSFGRLVGRYPTSPLGAYSIPDVPREGSTIVVEVDQAEVANRQIIPSPASMIFQDFNIAWAQIERARSKAESVTAAHLYKRSEENQKRFAAAEASLKDKKYKNAAAELERVVSSDDRDVYSWLYLGNAYFLADDLPKAEKAYAKVLDLDATMNVARVDLGRVYLAEKDYEKAVAVLAVAAEKEPTSPDANHYLGEAYLMLKKGSKAVGYLNEAIRLAPQEKAELHLRLAALYDGAGLKPKAADEYRFFLQKVPDFPKRKDLEKYIKENSK